MQTQVFDAFAKTLYEKYPDEAGQIETVCDSVYEAIDQGAEVSGEVLRGFDALTDLALQFDEAACKAYFANMSRAERLGWMKARDANVD